MADPKRAPEGLAAMEVADDLRDETQGPSLAGLLRASAAGGGLPDKGTFNNASTEAIRNMIPDLWKAAGDDQELKAMLYEIGVMVEPAVPSTVSGDQMPSPEDEERAAKARVDNFSRWLSGETGDDSIGQDAIEYLTLAATLGGGGSGGDDPRKGQNPNRPDPANQNRTPPKDNLTRGVWNEADPKKIDRVNIDPEGNILPPSTRPVESVKLNDPSVPRLTGPASEVLESGTMNDPFHRWKGAFVVDNQSVDFTAGGVKYSDWIDDINSVQGYTRDHFTQYLDEINSTKAGNPSWVPPKFSNWMRARVTGFPEAPLSQQIKDKYVWLRDGPGGAQDTPISGQVDDFGDDIVEAAIWPKPPKGGGGGGSSGSGGAAAADDVVGPAIWPKNPKDIPLNIGEDSIDSEPDTTGKGGGPRKPSNYVERSTPKGSMTSPDFDYSRSPTAPYEDMGTGPIDEAAPVEAGGGSRGSGTAPPGPDAPPPRPTSRPASGSTQRPSWAGDWDQQAAREAAEAKWSKPVPGASSLRSALKGIGAGVAAGAGATLAIELGYLLGSRHLSDADPSVLEKLNKVRNRLREMNGSDEVAELRGQRKVGYLDDSGLSSGAAYMEYQDSDNVGVTQSAPAPSKPKLPKVKPDAMAGTAAEARTAGIFSAGDMADTKDLSLRDSMKALYEKGLAKSKKKLDDNYTAKNAGIFSEEEEE